MPLPRRPVFIESLFDDPGGVQALVARHAPYWPVQRYFASAEEQRALSDSAERPGADIPAFRGVDRTTVPVWLLVTMGRSGLFERWRVRIATAVAWFYEGEGGGLTYWPDGPDETPATLAPRTNTALVGDNDVMFHRVESVGGADDDMVGGLTLDSELVSRSDGAWEVHDHGRVPGRWPASRVRVSLSWKALVFRDDGEARAVDEHTDDLSVATVLDVLTADLTARGVDVPASVEPLRDPAFVAAASRAYHASPTVYPWGRVGAG